MSRENIESMLTDILEEVDHDIYKAIFTCPEEPEEAKETVDALVEIVQKYLK